jgi:PIN domain nuclease of toxin-antitoxin system
MILLDTHVWIWWATNDKTLPSRLKTRIREENYVAVSAVSSFEIALLHQRGRLQLALDARTWINEAETAVDEVLPITSVIAFEAAVMDWSHRDPADRMITATALQHQLALVTRDRAIRDAHLVETIW